MLLLCGLWPSIYIYFDNNTILYYLSVIKDTYMLSSKLVYFISISLATQINNLASQQSKNLTLN